MLQISALVEKLQIWEQSWMILCIGTYLKSFKKWIYIFEWNVNTFWHFENNDKAGFYFEMQI